MSLLTKLDDILKLKTRLLAEVQQFRDVVEAQQEKDRSQFATLTERIGTLEAQLTDSEKEAALDALTEVPNRRSFDVTVRRWMESSANTKFALSLVDIDDFKRINDEHGHLVGDRVLKCAAQTLATKVGANDFVARYGGEEFVLMFAKASVKDAQRRMEDLINRIATSKYKYHLSGVTQQVSFTVSAGLAEFTRGDTLEELVLDDESLIRELVGTMLEGSGYEVRDVATVDEALSQMQTNPAALVITDLRMPGLGGEDLFKRVENHDSKFVFMTGDTMSPESQEEALTVSDRVAVIHDGQLQQIGTPDELYRKPANRFVAEFVGKMNLLPAAREGECVYRLQTGETIRTAEAGRRTHALVAVRPEVVRTRAENGWNQLEGTVAHRVFLGELTEIAVTLADGTLFLARKAICPRSRQAER